MFENIHNTFADSCHNCYKLSVKSNVFPRKMLKEHASRQATNCTMNSESLYFRSPQTTTAFFQFEMKSTLYNHCCKIQRCFGFHKICSTSLNNSCRRGVSLIEPY